MATGTLMNNPPTPHSSRNIPQTISNTGPSTPGVQPRNASVPQPTPDEVVDRLLDRAKSPLEEGEVRKVVEALEKVSRSTF